MNNVCFVEGLVQREGQWFLYYGTADSKIAVAVWQPHQRGGRDGAPGESPAK